MRAYPACKARVAHSLADAVLVLGRGVSAARTSCTCSQTCPTHTSPVTLRQYVCARSAFCVYALQELNERRMCPQYEDFGSSDASRLDTWTFDNVTSLFQQATSCVQTRRVWLACCCSSRHEIQRHGCVPCACAACARVYLCLLCVRPCVVVWTYLCAFSEAAAGNTALRRALHAKQSVFFLHLLGIDSNGHAHRPHSHEYKDNVKLVDRGVQSMFELFERWVGRRSMQRQPSCLTLVCCSEFNDGRTAYVFTSDHGMSNKGAHGDGEPANTRTPIVVWGAGIRPPIKVSAGDTPVELSPAAPRDGWVQSTEASVSQSWGLRSRMRFDIHQADVAPLLAALIGIDYPTNSVGVLPYQYMLPTKYRITALRANVEQLYTHVDFRARQQRERTLLFRPFQGGDRLDALRSNVDHLLEVFPQMQQHDVAIGLCMEAAAIALRGLRYFQTYTWAFIMSCATAGSVAWIGVQAVFVTMQFTGLRELRWKRRSWRFHFIWMATALAAVSLLYADNSPWRYHVYALLPIVFSAFVLAHPPAVVFWLLQLGIAYSKRRRRHVGSRVIDGDDTTHAHAVLPAVRWPVAVQMVATAIVCVEVSSLAVYMPPCSPTFVWPTQIMVVAFFWRPWFSVLLLVMAAEPWVLSRVRQLDASGRSPLLFPLWTVTCCALAIFPLLPVDTGDQTVGGAAVGVAPTAERC